MPVIHGDIELYLGPQQLGGGDDLRSAIIGFLDKAQNKQQLSIAVQEIDNKPIAEAIVSARLRGASIDLVIEQSYLLNTIKPTQIAEAWIAGGASEVNRELFAAILRSTTDVKVDFNPHIFHQKFMVLGNSVLTGSTNFTDTGTSRNLNHILIIHDAKFANSYKAEYRDIRAGRFGKEGIAHAQKPREFKVSGIRVKPLFAPEHAPEMEIMKQILKAKTRIDFAIFTFAQTSGIDDALIAAHQRGVKVRGVMDRQQANQKWAVKDTLHNAGVEIWLAGGEGPLNKLHHKMMAIDDQLSIFGSFNYTGPANQLNDENIVVIGDLEEADAQAQAAQGKIALAARTEIDRIIQDFGKLVQPG